MAYSDKVNVAILGAGKIGTNLLFKIERSNWLNLTIVTGRSTQTPGMRLAADMGVNISDRGIAALLDDPDAYDVVIDATDAALHIKHWQKLKNLNKKVIDLTPSNIGRMVVPSVNGKDSIGERNVSLISCGGQASLPIVHALAQQYPNAQYIELVTTVASASIGRGTRMNLDEYIDTTEAAIRQYSGAKTVKVLVNISPAKPPPVFRVALSMIYPGAEINAVRHRVACAEKAVQYYVPGYRVASVMVLENERIFVSIEVTGRGDRLPSYAGNLDIINDAAVVTAELYAKDFLAQPCVESVMMD